MESMPNTFIARLIISVKIFLKEIKSLLSIIIAFTLITLLLNIILAKFGIQDKNWFNPQNAIPVWHSLIIMIIYLAITGLISLLFSVSIVKTCSNLWKQEETGLNTTVHWTMENLKNVVITALIAFWYIFKIAFLPLTIVFIALLMLENFNQQPLMLIPIESIPATISQKTWIATGKIILTILLVGAIINAVIFGIIRGTKALFTLYAMVEEKAWGKKALQQSIKTVKGKFGKVFWNYFFASIIFTLVLSTPINMLIKTLKNVPVVTNNYYILPAINISISAIIGCLTIIFVYSLYKHIKQENTE